MQRIAAAFCRERQAGNDPVYLDMSQIPETKRDYYFHSMVKWMDLFLTKLDSRARIDMFGKTPYYPLNQMTKMAIRTTPDCRSSVQGLLAAGLAQAGCATHFAGFHIGLCIGNGWIAGRSAAEDAAAVAPSDIDEQVAAEHGERALARLLTGSTADSDTLLRRVQQLMFRYDVNVLKRADRLDAALGELTELRASADELRAPDAHELVRIHELAAMLQGAEIILQASAVRQESRLSHIREDFPDRDDQDWLRWVLVSDSGGMRFETEPIATPLVPLQASNDSKQKARAHFGSH
ncbi:MAG: hypothetical protein KGJ86_22720 [Chloroflexota bacterium]|nr:hypothetical protein [Chloroflexota bacterium]